MDGNEQSIERILAFYDPYISKCCLRPLYDEYGNVYIVVDMELKGRIREAIIKMILDFDIGIVQQKNKAIMAGHDLLKSPLSCLPSAFTHESLWLSPLFFDN